MLVAALIAAGFPSVAFAAEQAVPSVGETVEIVTSQERFAATADGVEEIAPADARGGVMIGPSNGVLTLPDSRDLGPRQVKEGLAVYQNASDGYAVAVNPFDGGTQVLTVLGSPKAPTTFTYGVAGDDEDVVIALDGSADVVETETGIKVANIDKPWAVDANGAEVPTHFVRDGRNLVQVVEHHQENVAYPVTADPKIFRCDANTHTCVKFTKSETKKISKQASVGTAARIFATTMCGATVQVMAIATCVAIVSVVSDSLKKSFRSAAKNGKCVELHFLGIAGALTRWKVEKC